MTEQKFLEYVRIQKSGLTNMFDAETVIRLSGDKLVKEDIMDIMKNYSKYQEKYSGSEEKK